MKRAELELTVVSGSGPTLMGRDWLSKLRLDWSPLHQVKPNTEKLQEILDKHGTIFNDILDFVKGTVAKIHMDASATPNFYRPRLVPYALRNKVEQELERLEQL